MTEPTVEFTTFMDGLVAISRPFTAISLGEVQAAIRTCDRAESLGPILVPTEFMHGADRVGRNKRFLRAVAAFVAALDELRPEDPPQ